MNTPNCKRMIMTLLMFLPVIVPVKLHAQAETEKPKIIITIDAAKEVRQFKNNKWVTQTVPVDVTRRGDVLVYTITYTNKGRSTAIDAAIVDPIPAGTVYVLESAQGENAEIGCSIDGGRFFQPPPAKYTVRKPDGTREEVVAPADLYTHIKWTIRKPVPPEKSGQLRFKVIVQ